MESASAVILFPSAITTESVAEGTQAQSHVPVALQLPFVIEVITVAFAIVDARVITDNATTKIFFILFGLILPPDSYREADIRG